MFTAQFSLVTVLVRIGFVGLLVLGSIGVALANVPIATTVTMADGPVPAGTVVRYDEESDRYERTQGRGDEAVYGVVDDRPPLVFVTATSSVPVVTRGVAMVAVSLENGSISRGDVLTTATAPGVAMRAHATATAVFAVALEAATSSGIVSAAVGVAEAQDRLATQQPVASTTEEDSSSLPIGRILIALALVGGALIFTFYSFRSISTSGLLSIGRNPRARRSVIGIAVGSAVLGLLLLGVVVFVALGILVLPV